MVQGLKALGQGVQRAVGQLGHEGGSLTNLDVKIPNVNVKIPMPARLRSVENKFHKPSLANLPSSIYCALS